jgi:UDP-N-acetylglucosamine 2-epimerase (non-hydrolysing)
MKQRLLIVVGSRPEAVKMAPLVMACTEQLEEFEVVLCSTGQQSNMIPQALAEFDLTPDISLEVMRPNQTLAELTARLMTALDKTITQTNPGWILVQGDTTSAMVGALAGFYRQVPVAHVEAGMRTGNPFSPFPEEVNRRIITQCATLHFAPTRGCEQILLDEGVPASQVFVTGNTVIDALYWTREKIAQSQSALPPDVLEKLNGHRRLVLVTTHRRESFGEGLTNTCLALQQLARSLDDIVIVFPVHPNPNVRDPVYRILGSEPNLLLIEPQPYRAFVELMNRAYIILTDSGGLQEEAPGFGKPVVVLRDTTERPEGVAAGCAQLVGTNQRDITRAALKLLTDPRQYAKMSNARNLYGDGTAGLRIAAILRDLHAASTPFNALEINAGAVAHMTHQPLKEAFL